MPFLRTQNFLEKYSDILKILKCNYRSEDAEIKLALLGLSKHIILESNISSGIERVIKKPFIYKKYQQERAKSRWL